MKEAGGCGVGGAGEGRDGAASGGRGRSSSCRAPARVGEAAQPGHGDGVGCASGGAATSPPPPALQRGGSGGGSFQGEGGWHLLHFLPTLDPATGRPALLVNESVLSKVKRIMVRRRLSRLRAWPAPGRPLGAAGSALGSMHWHRMP